MSKENNAILQFIGICAAVPLLFALRGWVLKTLWFWFLVPLGAPGILTAHVIGVSLVVTVFTYQPKSGNDEDKGVAYQYLSSLFLSIACLGFGWIIKSLM